MPTTAVKTAAAKPSRARAAWLETGLGLLGEQGVDGLTIDALAQRRERTKGSFYHHFRDWQQFAEALLAHWEEHNTLQIIELAEQGRSAVEKMDRLTELTVELPASPANAVRAWAQRDPVAAEYQRRVDRRRLAYVKQLCRESGLDAGEADLIAHIVYGLFVGAQQMQPAISPQKQRKLYRTLRERLL